MLHRLRYCYTQFYLKRPADTEIYTYYHTLSLPGAHPVYDYARGDPGVDQHRLLLRQVIGVQFRVPRLEGPLQPRQRLRRLQVQVAQLDADLEHLLAIAHVGGAPGGDLAVEPGPHAAAAVLAHPRIQRVDGLQEIGRASCRERVCPYV